MARSGSRAKVEISRDGVTWQDISAATYGTDGLNIAEPEGTVETGGGGSRTGMETTGYVAATASFTVDENERSRPVLTGWNARILHIRYQQQGTGAGRPQVVYRGPVTVSHSFGERDKRRYSVSMMVDGEPTRTVQ